MTYTPEMRAADAEIAKAMGWTDVKIRDWDRDGCISDYMGFPPPVTGSAYGTVTNQWQPLRVPRFHESHDARAALLEWLAADEGRWHRFDHAFFEQFIGQRDLDFVQIAFLATPAQVAEAALKVIKEEK